MRDIPSKVPGNIHHSYEFNSYVGEDKNLVTDVNIVLDDADSHQLGQSSAAYASTGNFFTDTGFANALNLVSSQYNFQTPQQYYNGMIVRCRSAATNTAAATMNVAGLGNKDIKLNGGLVDVPPGSIVAGVMTQFYYDLANDCMIYLGAMETASAVLPAYFEGFQTSDNGTVMTFGPGSCTSSDGQQLMVNYAPFDKNLTTTWAVGDGNGGVPSGVTLADNTPYYDFIISKPDGTVDFGLDDNLLATNLLSDAFAFGFTRAQRVRAHLTQLSSTNIETMNQVGREFFYVRFREDVDYNTGNPNNFNTKFTMSLPNTPCLGIFYCFGEVDEGTGGGSSKANIYCSEDFPLSINQRNFLQNSGNVSVGFRLSNTGEYRIISNDASVSLKFWDVDGLTDETSLIIYTAGWVDSQLFL